jgi:hypothetical protein
MVPANYARDLDLFDRSRTRLRLLWASRLFQNFPANSAGNFHQQVSKTCNASTKRRGGSALDSTFAANPGLGLQYRNLKRRRCPALPALSTNREKINVKRINC